MAFKIKTISGVDYLSSLIELNLSINNLTDEVVNDLILPSSLEELYLTSNQIVNFNPSNPLPSLLQTLHLGRNQIVTFDPTIALPNSIENLFLFINQIVTFNPTLPLPSSLDSLYLDGNQIVSFNPSVPLPSSSFLQLYLYSNPMTTAGYTASEPWANAMSVIPGRGNVYFTSNTDPVTGTNLETILQAKGWSVFG